MPIEGWETMKSQHRQCSGRYLRVYIHRDSPKVAGGTSASDFIERDSSEAEKFSSFSAQIKQLGNLDTLVLNVEDFYNTCRMKESITYSLTFSPGLEFIHKYISCCGTTRGYRVTELPSLEVTEGLFGSGFDRDASFAQENCYVDITARGAEPRMLEELHVRLGWREEGKLFCYFVQQHGELTLRGMGEN
ncbi:hypothetical protein EYF80_013327 [Liparis tanakae]|uniref:Uncharacterized protein n=1 Tax=Liparis tanakae TaxID=230148 RepID=A0A4Z2IGM2_9TELE|nr:hypothetical protein EYF80_013327 [Liparis tanakae]